MAVLCQSICPDCGSHLVKPKSEAALLGLPGVIFHDSEIICSNRKCGYHIDLTLDPYRLRLAVLTSMLRKPEIFSEECLWAVKFLGICAGRDEKLAQYLGFENFRFLQKYKIDLANRLGLIDEDTNACVEPFYRETKDLIAKKLGFASYSVFEEELKKKNPGEKLEKSLREMIGLIDVSKAPRTELEGGANNFILHIYY